MSGRVLGLCLALALGVNASAAEALPYEIYDAQVHEDYTVFHAGRTLDGAKLRGVWAATRRVDHRRSFKFRYDVCRRGRGGERICRARYVIRNHDACVRNANTNDHPATRIAVRGVPADLLGAGDHPRLVVYTGRTAVSISAPSDPLAVAAAEALRSANMIVTRDDQLPAASEEVLSGRGDCSRAAARPFAVKGAIDGWLSTDGDRWATWRDAESGATIVYDEDRGAAETVATPEGCVAPSAVRGRWLLWWCRPHRRVLNLETRTEEPAQFGSGSSCGYAVSHDSPVGIGDQWVATWAHGHHNLSACYYNWRTGAHESGGTNARDDGKDRQWPDLDAPGLWRELCAPLTRRDNANNDPYQNGPAYFQYSYDGAFGVTQLRDGGPVVLDRCGRPEGVALSECAAICNPPQLGARLVTWTEGMQEVGIVDLRTGWRARWSAPLGYRILNAAHTRRHVLAAVARQDGTTHLAVARIPGR